MDFHPSQIPIEKTFDIKDEKDAESAAEEMVKIGFTNQKKGFKVLMPKDKRLAKRAGYIVTTGLNFGLRKTRTEFWFKKNKSRTRCKILDVFT